MNNCNDSSTRSDDESPVSDACVAIRPLLFAAAEGEIGSDDRLEVHAHLAVCDACRSWERGERALTALMVESTDPRVPMDLRSGRFGATWTKRLSLCAAILIGAMLLFVLPAATPRGLLIERTLGPERDWQVAQERPLQGQDIIEVPAAATATLRLGDGVQLDAVGPARMAVEAVSGTWRVTVDGGTVAATITGTAELLIGGDGAQRLAAGHWRLSRGRVERLVAAGKTAVALELAASESAKLRPSLTPEAIAERLEAGTGSFAAGNAESIPGFGTDAQGMTKFAEAEELLRAVVAAEHATDDQVRRALFYLACSVSRQGRKDESFQLECQWLRRFPDESEAPLVRFYMACYLRDHDQVDAALKLYQQVSKEEGDSSLGHAARSYMSVTRAAQGEAARQPASEPSAAKQTAQASATTRPLATGGAESGYLVVRVGLSDKQSEHDGFRKVAALAAKRHSAKSVAWSGEHMAELESALRQRNPENVLFVLPPERLDLVLHRRILMLCYQLDADWFCDFAFGYLTAANGDKVQALWQRIEQVRARGTLTGDWLQASVTVGDKTLFYDDSAPPVAKAAGFEGPHYYYKPGPPETDELVMRSLQEMQNAEVIELTGCGDPTGIWLFDDHRNIERELHWDYDPARVGDDPDGSMPRLLPSHFRKLKLQQPILWSGTCHSGAVNRVFVEGDIVSTFGRAQNATVHVMKPEDSLALSWLDAGAAGLLVPLGANHGMSVSMEVDFALRNGASLGETVQSTYNDVLLAARGELALDLPVEGQPHQSGEPVMQGGGANRILIGDPALRPFVAVKSDAEQVDVQRTGSGLRVTVTRAKGWQPRAWDMFGLERGADYRALVRVDLTAAGITASHCEATVSAVSPNGTAMSYALRRCALERHAGRVYLHLQANGTRAALDRKAAKITFGVTCKE